MVDENEEFEDEKIVNKDRMRQRQAWRLQYEVKQEGCALIT